MKQFLPLVALLSFAACAEATDVSQTSSNQTVTERDAVVASAVSGPQAPYMSDAPEGLATAIFAGGCFWCTEKDFEDLDGVIEATSGYTGGRLDNPDYRTVSYTETGHFEAVEVTYDPSIVSYETLVDYYWTTIDPTDAGGQFCDKGSSYRSAIFATAEQMQTAQESLSELEQTKPFADLIQTDVLPAVTFYDAEEYHQDYYKKNPVRYRLYRSGCGRDARLKALWGNQAKSLPEG